MKKSSKTVAAPQPSKEFYKNVEAIIKEAEALGIDKLVLQKKEPGQPTGEFHMPPKNIPASAPVQVPISTENNDGTITYGYCDVTVPVDKVIKSPVFFMENDQKSSTFISLPTPISATSEYLNDFINMQKLLDPNFINPSRLINDINFEEFTMAVNTNVYAVFYNGLYSFLKPFLNISQDQAATIFKFEDIRNKYSILGELGKYRKPEEMINSVSSITVKIATIVGNAYFNFVNTVLIHGFVNLKELAKYLAEVQGISFDKVSEKQYYMFVEGCLLEIASEDVHKIIEIVEANTVQLKGNHLKEEYDWDEDDE